MIRRHAIRFGTALIGSSAGSPDPSRAAAEDLRDGWSRWSRPVAFGLAVVLLALASIELVDVARSPWGQGLIASDISKGYLAGARRFLETGSPYLPEQLAGPWSLEPHSFIHPPAALLLFLPFLVLPLVTWWLVPLLVTVVCVARLRPAAWTWPVMALCLCWPRSTGALLAGNTDLWAMAFLAAGAVWRWPVVLLVVKPTFAPLGVIGARHRSTWVAAAVVAAGVLVTLPLWLDWLTVIRHADLGLAYSLLNLPLVLIPVVAWLGRRT